MEHFLSFYQFIAAVNFAFVFSKDYLKSIKMERIDVLFEKRNGSQNSLDSILDYLKFSEYINKNLDIGIKNYFDKIEALRNELIALENMLHRYKRNQFSDNFNSYSFFAGIYCVFLLLILGFANYLKTNISDQFNVLLNLVFLYQNLCSLILIIFIIKSKIFRFSLKSVVIVLILATLIALIFTSIQYYFTKDIYNFNPINILLGFSIIIPIIHFIHGFIISIFIKDEDFETLNYQLGEIDRKIFFIEQEVISIELNNVS
jgi:hypothetical protein